MGPKEKAIELVDKFYQTTPNEGWLNPPLGSSSMEYTAWGQAKECALIAVDEMIVQNGDIYLAMLGDKANDYYGKMNGYLFEVKQEIEKL